MLCGFCEDQYEERSFAPRLTEVPIPFAGGNRLLIRVQDDPGNWSEPTVIDIFRDDYCPAVFAASLESPSRTKDLTATVSLVLTDADGNNLRAFLGDSTKTGLEYRLLVDGRPDGEWSEIPTDELNRLERSFEVFVRLANIPESQVLSVQVRDRGSNVTTLSKFAEVVVDVVPQTLKLIQGIHNGQTIERDQTVALNPYREDSCQQLPVVEPLPNPNNLISLNVETENATQERITVCLENCPADVNNADPAAVWCQMGPGQASFTTCQLQDIPIAPVEFGTVKIERYPSLCETKQATKAAHHLASWLTIRLPEVLKRAFESNRCWT